MERIINKINECDKNIKELKIILAILQKDRKEASIIINASETINGAASNRIEQASHRITISQDKTPTIYDVIVNAVSKDLEKCNKDLKQYAEQLYKGI